MNMLLQSKRQSLGELAYEFIRESIITLKLEPGQMVYEAELAEQLGVSRTPIREAFRMLLTDDLIQVIPQKGARISLISKSKVEETRFVREVLESSAFKQAANLWRSGEERFEQLHKQILILFEELQRAIADEDPTRFLKLDEQFHQLILSITNNGTLLSVVNNMRSHLNRVRYISILDTARMKVIMEEHNQILEAVVRNNQHAIDELLHRHVGLLDFTEIERKFPHYFIP